VFITYPDIATLNSYQSSVIGLRRLDRCLGFDRAQ
jgi:hypothetical protein